MALMSVGRNVAVAERIRAVGPLGTRSAEEVRAEADKKLAEAQKSLLETLTPWIPGDFVVTYGVLLTAWSGMRASFLWMVVVAAVLALTFVVLGAFAETGFKKAADRSKKFRTRLAVRTIIGFFVSVYASIAIPGSGWYGFKWFTENELSSVVTAGVLAAILVLALKGFQKRLGYSIGTDTID